MNTDGQFLKKSQTILNDFSFTWIKPKKPLQRNFRAESSLFRTQQLILGKPKTIQTTESQSISRINPHAVLRPSSTWVLCVPDVHDYDVFAEWLPVVISQMFRILFILTFFLPSKRLLQQKLSILDSILGAIDYMGRKTSDPKGEKFLWCILCCGFLLNCGFFQKSFWYFFQF